MYFIIEIVTYYLVIASAAKVEIPIPLNEEENIKIVQGVSNRYAMIVAYIYIQGKLKKDNLLVLFVSSNNASPSCL